MKKTAKRELATEFLPEHSIRVSKKARRVILRIHPDKGLEVVLPQGVSASCVPDVLGRHESWIKKHLARQQEKGWAASTQASQNFPRSFYLKGGLELIKITAADPVGLFGPEPWEEALPPGGVAPDLVIEKELFMPRRCRGEAAFSRLREWVRQEARAYLGGMLEQMAERHGLRYGDFSVRFQKTRWGSCSAKGNINLNGCLLFLPQELALHVALHELCHLRHMNHSEDFWRLLFKMEPEALALDKALRSGWRYVPGWIFK